MSGLGTGRWLSGQPATARLLLIQAKGEYIPKGCDIEQRCEFKLCSAASELEFRNYAA
jgi:hypothetical protein